MTNQEPTKLSVRAIREENPDLLRGTDWRDDEFVVVLREAQPQEAVEWEEQFSNFTKWELEWHDDKPLIDMEETRTFIRTLLAQAQQEARVEELEWVMKSEECTPELWNAIKERIADLTSTGIKE